MNSRMPYLWYHIKTNLTEPLKYLNYELIMSLLVTLIQKIPYMPQHVTYLEVYVRLTGVLLEILYDFKQLFHLGAIESPQELIDNTFSGCQSTLHIEMGLL